MNLEDLGDGYSLVTPKTRAVVKGLINAAVAAGYTSKDIVSLPDGYKALTVIAEAAVEDPDTNFDEAIAEVLRDPGSETRALQNATYGTPAYLRSVADRFPSAINFAPENTDDIPTVTVGPSATVTGRKIPVRPDGSGVAREIGARGFWDETFNRIKSGSRATVPGVDFMLSGDTAELQFTGGSTTSYYLVDVDGKLAVDFTSMTTTTGSNNYIKLVFPSSKVRRVTLYIADLPTAFNGLTVPLTASVDAAPKMPCIGVVGDSYFGGSNGSKMRESYGWHLARALKAELGGSGAGGSGYIDGGSTSKPYAHPDRLAAMREFNPDIIFIVGTGNDDEHPREDITAAATSCYDSYAETCPGVPIVVVSEMASNATVTISASAATRNKAIRDAAEAHPAVVAYYDPIGTSDGTVPIAWTSGYYGNGARVTHLGSVWASDLGDNTDGDTWNQTPGSGEQWRRVTWGYDGTGRVGATTGDGNRDVCLYSDSTHPTATGQIALALPMIDAIRDLFAQWRAAPVA